jgi:hypothetical protein
LITKNNYIIILSPDRSIRVLLDTVQVEEIARGAGVCADRQLSPMPFLSWGEQGGKAPQQNMKIDPQKCLKESHPKIRDCNASYNFLNIK